MFCTYIMATVSIVVRGAMDCSVHSRSALTGTTRSTKHSMTRNETRRSAAASDGVIGVTKWNSSILTRYVASWSPPQPRPRNTTSSRDASAVSAITRAYMPFMVADSDSSQWLSSVHTVCGVA